MAQKLTVFIVGPPKTGKTAIANYLADLAESLNGNEYHPTQGVRILEFEKHLSQSKGKDIAISVEAWDCSGDPSYITVWPAVASSAAAVVFVCTPDRKQDKDLEAWYSMFSFLNPATQMCIFYNKIGLQGVNAAKLPKPKFGKVLSKIPVYHTNLLDENDTSRSDFETLLFSAYNVHNENREREEQLVLNH
ncbi:UNVERIFIED_CONTAM: Intraflagellar transport protein 22 [Siphonaria sp. JEL0065]|nr:Intraflagellar transport protein 22 [Siphonaria sp. JEL0065]